MRCVKCLKELESAICGSCGFDHHSAPCIHLLATPSSEELIIAYIGEETTQEQKVSSSQLPEFEINGDTLIKYNGTSENVQVPTHVRHIGESAFKYKPIRSVHLPVGLTSIGHSAFLFCTELEEIVLPKSLRFIETWAFSDCRKLRQIEFPEGLQEIDWSFSHCTSLKEVTFPSTLLRMDGFSFLGCKSLEKAVFRKGIQRIDLMCFNGCDSLKTIAVPDSLVNLDVFGMSLTQTIRIEASEKWVIEHWEFFQEYPNFVPTISGNVATLTKYAAHLSTEAYDLFQKKDYPAAFRLFEQATKLGHNPSKTWLAYCYSTGTGITRNEDLATFWYRKSAECGNSDAYYELAKRYAKGIGVERNYTEAYRWVLPAIEKDNRRACFLLGEFYEGGWGVEQNLRTASYWYYQAINGAGKNCPNGDAERYYEIAREFQLGYIQKDAVMYPSFSSRVGKFYLLAAQLGSMKAQFELGYHYEKGKYVAKNFEEAVKWYKRAGEKGHKKACKRLGEMYEIGLGVKGSFFESMRWKRRAE